MFGPGELGYKEWLSVIELTRENWAEMSLQGRDRQGMGQEGILTQAKPHVSQSEGENSHLAFWGGKF